MTKTLTLKEAAAFLKMHPEALRRKAKTGKIPGAKPGKSWVFLEEDLVEYLRSLYANKRQAVRVARERKEVTACHSSAEVKSGGLTSTPPVVKECERLLGLKTG